MLCYKNIIKTLDEFVRCIWLYHMHRETRKLEAMVEDDTVLDTRLDRQSEKVEFIVDFYDTVLPEERDACKICIII